MLGKQIARGEMKGRGVNRKWKKRNREERDDKGCRGVEAMRTLSSPGCFHTWADGLDEKFNKNVKALSRLGLSGRTSETSQCTVGRRF